MIVVAFESPRNLAWALMWVAILAGPVQASPASEDLPSLLCQKACLLPAWCVGELAPAKPFVPEARPCQGLASHARFKLASSGPGLTQQIWASKLGQQIWANQLEQTNWNSRSGLTNWNSRSEQANWHSRSEQANWHSRSGQTNWGHELCHFSAGTTPGLWS